jgi:superfamily II DNA or RNA helicase
VTEIKLRDYQREAIDAVFAAWKSGMKRPAIVLPTGAGKTVVFSALVKEFMPWADDDTVTGIPANHGKRVIILAHRDELVDQAIAKLRAVMPGVNVGKVKAQDRQTAADVMVCSVQTLSRDKSLQEMRDWAQDVGKIGLIITDECHHAAAASYKKIYAAFPDALQLGVTATMARGDGVGLGSTWEDVVYKRSILNLISKGHLVDVRTKRIDLKGLDLGGVKTSMKDWQAGDLGRALMDAEADTAIARAYKAHAGSRQGIVFTPTVETAVAAQYALGNAGIPSAVVSGETPREDRQQLYQDYRTGKCQVLVNCMVLTEGFDMPQAEVAVIARPTQSSPLYTQMVGRVLRPWPGKKEALVLDLVGASANKLRTLIDLEPGAVQSIEDDESLAEAVVREAEQQNQKVPAGSLAFELKVRDVDSFGASDTAWARTPAGVMFIDCGTARVFLWPTPEQSELWDVCVAETGKKWQRTSYTGLSVGEAMAWAEAVAEDHQQQFGVAKSAAWRKKKPSDAAKNLAANLGIEVTEGMRAGELSALIDSRMGGRVFDRFVGKG